MKSPFPQDWQEHTIEDCLCRVEHPVKVYPDTLYTQIGIRSHGKGLFYKEPVTGESLGNKAVYWIEPDCLVLNIVFAWEQAIGKTTQAEVGMIGSHRFPMYKPVNNLVDIDYLIYYLLTKRGTDILEAASPGGAGRNRTLGQDRFMKSRIVLPPLDEQRKIAEILATQDRAIELQGCKIEELKRFKQGCLERMFPREGQKVPEKRFPGFSGDWEQRKVPELLKNTSDAIKIGPFGSALKKSFFTDKGIKVYAQENAFTGDFSIGNYYISEEKYNELKSCELKPGDLVISMMGTVGACAIFPENAEEGIMNSHLLRLQFSEEVLPEYIMFLLRDSQIIRDQIDRLSVGSIMTGLSSTVVKKLVFPVPQRPEQQKIVELLKLLDNLITLHQRKLDEMKNQKKALMQLLLTGIVRVRS